MQPALQQHDRPAVAVPKTQPFISVVVPVRNEARHLAATLGQLLNQDYRTDRFEILVADGRSTDGTRHIVGDFQAQHDNVYLLDNPKILSSAGRNRAIEAARGDIVVIVDGHCDLRNERYLRDLADAFARSGADTIGRPQPLDVAGARATPLQRAVAAARSSRLGHHPSSHVYSTRAEFVRPDSVAVAYRREVFDAVGLFDEAFDACEDVEFNRRVEAAGFSCFFAPETRVFYCPRASLGGLFHQMVRYGRGRVRLAREHGERLSLPCLVPAAFVATLVMAAPLAALVPALRGALAALMAIYAAVVLAVGARCAVREKSPSLLMWLPLVFPAIHVGAGAGILRELFGPRAHLALSRRAVPGVAAGGDKLRSSPLQSFTLPASEPAPLNALTFDVEDYFQVTGFENLIARSQWDGLESRVVGNTHKILEILERASSRATFFVLGWVADKHPELVRAIRAAGHEIGCHGYWHRLIYRQTPDEFRQDLCRARDALEDIIGERVTAFRAPSFSITQQSLWALDVLIQEGFTVDSSIFPTRHDRYGIVGAAAQPHELRRRGGTIWEFPLPVRRVLGHPLPVGGGGYFRLYPYRLTHRLLRAINAEGQPFATYLHPWEFDPEQPRFAAGRLQTFRHCVNLHRTEARLTALLRDFRFGTLTESLQRCGATQTSSVRDLARAA